MRTVRPHDDRARAALGSLSAVGAGVAGFGAGVLFADRVPALRRDRLEGALWSPHERRVESRLAIPRLARYIEEGLGVTFMRSTLVKEVETPRLRTTRGDVMADAVIVCPGHDLQTLFPGRLGHYGITQCKLHMMRVAPAEPRPLGAAVMSDLGLVRYLGYATFAVETLYLASETIGSIIGTSGFFLVAGLVVAMIAWAVIALERRFSRNATGAEA